jgi:hypothetical protein
MINWKIFHQLNRKYNLLLLRICFHRSLKTKNLIFLLKFNPFRPLVVCENPEDYPESYRSNTKKEELILTFVENFRRQYHYIYRDRKPLLLNPLNECGVTVNLPVYSSFVLIFFIN